MLKINNLHYTVTDKPVVKGITCCCLLAIAAPTFASIGTMKTIPAEYHGEWRINIRGCRTDSDTPFIRFAAKKIAEYEAGGDVTNVETRVGGGIKVHSNWEEGVEPEDRFKNVHFLKLERKSRYLQEFDASGKASTLWRRCPAGEKK